MSEKTQLNTDATKAVTCDYHNATGVIKHSLKNDMVFHMVMNKSKKALKGLISIFFTSPHKCAIFRPNETGYKRGHRE